MDMSILQEPVTHATPARLTPQEVRKTRIVALTDQAAAFSYRLEQEVIGAEHVEPWSALSEAQRVVYRQRVQRMTTAGIGYLHCKALDWAVRRVSDEHDVYGEYNEDAARDIEKMLGEVVSVYDGELLTQWRERTR